METTIKVSKETKDRILSLRIADKSKTFDMIINELVSYYKNHEGKYKKDYGNWQKTMDKYNKGRTEYEKEYTEYKKDKVRHKKRQEEYERERKVWRKLLKWAKGQGFKG
ncbi:hypothetical protein CMI42_04060 [Candidatus Pacearchaeota archaeon]|nr:hypothetical protein [Candidatus Pacearchaeota archaeon]|tara:strand:- start:3550 stop:3876 length:327 start_codon:yes stop_codon:yes gene_type:complete